MLESQPQKNAKIGTPTPHQQHRLRRTAFALLVHTVRLQVKTNVNSFHFSRNITEVYHACCVTSTEPWNWQLTGSLHVMKPHTQSCIHTMCCSRFKQMSHRMNRHGAYELALLTSLCRFGQPWLCTRSRSAHRLGNPQLLCMLWHHTRCHKTQSFCCQGFTHGC